MTMVGVVVAMTMVAIIMLMIVRLAMVVASVVLDCEGDRDRCSADGKCENDDDAGFV